METTPAPIPGDEPLNEPIPDEAVEAEPLVPTDDVVVEDAENPDLG